MADNRLEKVRKEIERRIQTLEEIEKASSDDNMLSLCNTKILALYGILNFIDSMQEEPVSQVIRPQNQWKPSEEQLIALRSVVTELKHSDNKHQETIEDLYNDLKKL